MKAFFLCAALCLATICRADILYVANFFDGDIGVIDTELNVIIATIDVSSTHFAEGVAVTPDGSKLYATFRGGGTSDFVAVIDTATNTVISMIGVADDPREVAITPDGSLALVVAEITEVVNVINVSTETVTATVPVGGSPRSIAISPTGTIAFVTNRDDASISVIDYSSPPAVIKTITIDVSAAPFGISIAPDGTKGYVVSQTTGMVDILDVGSQTILGSISTGGANGQQVTFTHDGKTAYVTNFNPVNNGNVTVIDVASNTVTTTIQFPPTTNPYDTVVTCSNSTLYVSEGRTTDQISVVDTATNTRTAIITTGNEPRLMTMLPCGFVATGESIKNIFLTQTDLINVLTWSLPVGAQPASYQIFREGELIGQVFGADNRRFEDHNRKKGTLTFYIIRALNSSGNSLANAEVFVFTPS